VATIGAICSGLNAAGSPPVQLRNGGFEDSAAGWEFSVYGARGAAGSQEQVRHGGRAALRIASAEPSDAAAGQEVQLKPRQWYRFTGWVKTDNLQPLDATTWGTFQIQRPGGQGVIAAGGNHGGDTDWTRVAIYFETPGDGRVRVCAFFAGFGKGTGTAWFDDLALEPVDLSRQPIRVTRQPLNGGAGISPYQYGQFIEYLCNSVPAIWAEKLYDGSFEGLSPYQVAYLKETDFREKPWYPSGMTHRAAYKRDAADHVTGKTTQSIEATGDTPCVVGVSQDGIAVRPDVTCTFSCWIRAVDLHRPVRVVLHRENEVLASAEFEPAAEWKKFTAKLAPASSETNATLSIQFAGPGKLWLDNASLMPDDNVGGWRRDAVEALRALNPGIIRFGGSALDAPEYGDFEWRDTIGDVERRKPWRAWGGLQPIGAGLEEFVQLCKAVTAEPLICVRTRNRAPSDAADEVEYFNGSARSPMGALRAKHGHAEPYGVKFWQIGNERTGLGYEAQIAPFATAMRRVDPTIKLLSSFPSEGTLKLAGDQVDYLCPHQYDVMNLGGAEAELRAVRDLIRRSAPRGRNIRVAVTEWNTTAGDFGPKRARLWTLENALAVARYHNLLHRNADLVEIANRSNLSNSFCSGILQTDNHRLYETPAYYAQKLYATLAGTRALAIESGVPANTAPDVSATLSADERTITIFAVNASTAEVGRVLDLSAFASSGTEVGHWTLGDRDAAGQPDVSNSFADPERVGVSHGTLTMPESRQLSLRFPPLTLSVFQLRLRP
jgi:alpha-N-arabinofuranosidase